MIATTLLWYLGVGVVFSLFVPMQAGRTDVLNADVDKLWPTSAGTRVLIGLLWPLVAIVWFVGVIKGN